MQDLFDVQQGLGGGLWLTVCERRCAVGGRVVVEAGEALVVATVSDGDVHGSAAAWAGPG